MKIDRIIVGDKSLCNDPANPWEFVLVTSSGNGCLMGKECWTLNAGSVIAVLDDLRTWEEHPRYRILSMDDGVLALEAAASDAVTVGRKLDVRKDGVYYADTGERVPDFNRPATVTRLAMVESVLI